MPVRRVIHHHNQRPVVDLQETRIGSEAGAGIGERPHLRSLIQQRQFVLRPRVDPERAGEPVREGVITVKVPLPHPVMPRLHLLTPNLLRQQKRVTVVRGVPLLQNLDPLPPVVT